MSNIRILFAGDFCPINKVEQLALKGKADAVFGNVLTQLHDKDLSVINLECPLTKRNSPIRKNGPNLKADPRTIECIKAGGFDIVDLANNHIADYGSSAVKETIHLLQTNNLMCVGAGSSLSNAQRELHVNCKRKAIAFLAFAENDFNWADEEEAGAWPLDPVINISQIKKARTDADIVIVLVHGGNEYDPVPSPRLVKTYRAFVDAGASTVIGTHPHVPQGYEIYKNSPIFYSLGNFLFRYKEEATNPLWSKSFAARLLFQENNVKRIEIIPYKTSTETGCLTLLKGEEFDEFSKYTVFLSKILRDDREIKKYWNAWCALMGPQRLRSSSLFFPIASVYALMPSKNLSNMKRFLAARNQIACEAHNEILVTYMDLIGKEQIKGARDYIPTIKTLQRGKIPQ